jgi:tetratricopeptide (TPR) repeat protein
VAFEKAIALDPNHVAARIGLSQFYLGAPGIAGGSVAKARAQGEALLALPDKRGEFQGRMVLGGIAAHESDWAEMSRQLTAAEPVVARYLKAASADDLTAVFLDGEVKRELGRCAEALPRYDQVIAKVANARGSRWGAAVCREQLGQKDAARKDYEEFARRFPTDDHAKEAQAAIKRLSGS